MQNNHFLILKKFKNTESAQLWATAEQCVCVRARTCVWLCVCVCVCVCMCVCVSVSVCI